MLLNQRDPRPADMMISHSWSGAVVETTACLESLVNLHMVSPSRSIFFCTLCIYQPQDEHELGLSIQAQLQLRPFAKIIASSPSEGMCVLHTTESEVYERMWCVHEVDEVILQPLPARLLAPQ